MTYMYVFTLWIYLADVFLQKIYKNKYIYREREKQNSNNISIYILYFSGEIQTGDRQGKWSPIYGTAGLFVAVDLYPGEATTQEGERQGNPHEGTSSRGNKITL